MKLKNKYISRVYQLIEDRSQMGHLTEITQSCVFQSVVCFAAFQTKPKCKYHMQEEPRPQVADYIYFK